MPAAGQGFTRERGVARARRVDARTRAAAADWGARRCGWPPTGHTGSRTSCGTGIMFLYGGFSAFFFSSRCFTTCSTAAGSSRFHTGFCQFHSHQFCWERVSPAEAQSQDRSARRTHTVCSTRRPRSKSATNGTHVRGHQHAPPGWPRAVLWEAMAAQPPEGEGRVRQPGPCVENVAGFRLPPPAAWTWKCTPRPGQRLRNHGGGGGMGDRRTPAISTHSGNGTRRVGQPTQSSQTCECFWLLCAAPRRVHPCANMPAPPIDKGRRRLFGKQPGRLGHVRRAAGATAGVASRQPEPLDTAPPARARQ